MGTVVSFHHYLRYKSELKVVKRGHLTKHKEWEEQGGSEKEKIVEDVVKNKMETHSNLQQM